jgi:RNA polymerase sigma factor for flagellar operon FliA
MQPHTYGSGGVSGQYEAARYPAAVPEETDAERRERLILEHLPQVRLIARRIHERLPDSVSLDDLVSAGVVGLIAAVDNFDPDQGVKLKTYAEYKIRGAILDSLRDLDWAPREKRKRARQVENAISAAEQRWKRAATEEEIAAELSLEVEEYREWLVEIRGLDIGSLELGGSGAEPQSLLKFIPDADAQSPSRLLERSELERLLGEAIGGMPKIERVVLTLYFEEEMTLREIAQIVNLHESRISQLKSQAILRLRSHMERCWPVVRGL